MYMFVCMQGCVCVACVFPLCRRNLEYYDMCHHEKVRQCDSDCIANSGELTVKIPKDTYSTPGMGELLYRIIFDAYFYLGVSFFS